MKVEIQNPDNIDRMIAAIEQMTEKTGLKIVEIAKANAPVDEGHYRSAIEYDGANTVIANMPYSADIEYGTNAHEIRPVTAQALHFKQNGKDVFYKKVNHPGTKPNPVMRMAARTVQKEVPQLFKEAQRENGL